MEPISLALGAATVAVQLTSSLAARCKQLGANRVMFDQLATRLDHLSDMLAPERVRAKKPSATWDSAVETLSSFLRLEVVPFLEESDKRAGPGSKKRNVFGKALVFGKAHTIGDSIAAISRRLDTYILDLSFTVNVNGFADVSDKVGEAQSAIEAVHDGMGTVMRRMLIMEELLLGGQAALVKNADELRAKVDAIAVSPEISEREKVVAAVFEAPGRAACVASSAPVGTFVPPPQPAVRPPVAVPVPPAARRPPLPPRSPAAPLATPAYVAASPPPPAADVKYAPSPGTTISDADTKTVSAMGTGESVLSTESSGSGGGGDAVDEEYMKVMSMRKRLDPQVLGLLTELDDNTSLREDERDEMRDVLRSLWEPWYIPRDKIQYTLKNGAKKVLGTGGYGRVYLASVPTADGSMLPVAVKELDGVFAKPKFKVDFEREVALLRDLSHPCIIGFVGAAWPESQMTCRAHNAADGANGFLDDTYGDGLDDDQDETAIIVTERMNCNLSSALRKGLLSDDGTKARAMLDVSEGMVYLHAKRVVHMDIKPENMLCRTKDTPEGRHIDGRVKISDFGVSQTKRDTSSRTMTHCAGTKLFMAPELMRRGRKLRLSSDVWSFGIMLCTVFADINDVEDLSDEDITAEANARRLAKAYESSLLKIEHLGVRLLASACVSDEETLRPRFPTVRDCLRAIVNGDPVERVEFILDCAQRIPVFEDGLRHLLHGKREAAAQKMNRAVGIALGTDGSYYSLDVEVEKGLRALPAFVVQAVEWQQAAVECSMQPEHKRDIRSLLLMDFLRSDKCYNVQANDAARGYLARHDPATNSAAAFFSGLLTLRSATESRLLTDVPKRDRGAAKVAVRLFQMAFSDGDSWAAVYLAIMMWIADSTDTVTGDAGRVYGVLQRCFAWNCPFAIAFYGTLLGQGSFGMRRDLPGAQTCFERAMQMGDHFLSPCLLTRHLITAAGTARFGKKVGKDQIYHNCMLSIKSGNPDGARLIAEFHAERGEYAVAEHYANTAISMGDRDGLGALVLWELRDMRFRATKAKP